MKKKKPPIILGAVLLVLLGFVAVMNSGSQASASEQKEPPQEQVLSGPHKTDSKDDLKDTVNQSLNKKKMHDLVPVGESGPLIVPQKGNFKPKPNPEGGTGRLTDDGK